MKMRLIIISLQTFNLFTILISILSKISTEIIFDNDDKYTEFHTGNLNILLSIPHDGQLQPTKITNRTSDVSNNLKGDYNTRKFGILVRSKLTSLFNKNNNDKNENKIPFMIFNNLHRIKMDPNRDDSDCCANKNESSFNAYQNYHKFITEKFEQEFMENGSTYKQALLVDIHGQSHPENWIEIGYLLTSTQLNTIKNLTDYESTSLNSLASISSFKFNDIIRGSVSLGSFIEQNYGLKVVPSSTHPSPNDGNYYSGGYITKEYSSIKRKVRINAIQIELPYSMRINGDIEYYTSCIAESIYKFYMKHNLNESK